MDQLTLKIAERSPGPYERFVKRALDVVLSAAAVLLLLPVLLLVAVAVAYELGRPILFLQQRMGRDGKSFRVVKFRTMGLDRRGHGPRHPNGMWSGSDRRETHKSDMDPRHTRLGRFLRSSSVDELPQLWNVLCGHMSLVGPRPELVSVVERYDPWQHQRHLVRPGMTGLWQVSARGEHAMHQVTHIDLMYIEQLCLRTDFRILLQTPAAALLKRTGS